MKHRKTGWLALGMFTGMLAGVPALARDNISYDYATVIDAEPVIETVTVSTPRRECWQEEVVYREYGRRDRRHNDNDAVGTVVGGIVGGAIGNAVGHKKRNKQVGAVVGAVLGATVGHAISSNNNSRKDRTWRDEPREWRETEEVCEVYEDSHEEERIVGYDVRYRYNNETYSIRTDRDPGDTIRVRLAVSPII